MTTQPPSISTALPGSDDLNSGIASVGLSGKRVLVVEDDSFLHSILSKRLEAEGVTVDNAANGAEALALIEKNIPDIMVTDVLMPGVNGFEVIQHMRSNDATKNVPVVVVSNFSQQEDKDKAEQLGASYLVKALVSPDDIVTRVKSYFIGSAAPASDAHAPVSEAPQVPPVAQA